MVGSVTLRGSFVNIHRGCERERWGNLKRARHVSAAVDEGRRSQTFH